MASRVKAKGRVVRRTALEMAAWGIWEMVRPGALDAAIQGLQARLAELGSDVLTTGTSGPGYALSRR